MNGKPVKPAWIGIPPSPLVFAQLDQEETSVLALLAWSSATNRPVTASDLAALPDRNGTPLGSTEVRHITKNLAELKVASVLGLNNERPLSIFLGGFQPATARRFERRPEPRPQAPDHRGGSSYPKAKPGLPMEHSTGNLEALKTTSMTPAFVPAESKRLRDELNRVTKFVKDPLRAAVVRKRILTDRISLYERWLTIEPGHPELPRWLERKRKALPELERDIERARAK